MMRNAVMRVVLGLLFSGPMACAADVAGAWRLAYTTENGLPREATLNLTQKGDDLAGTLSSDRGLARIDASTLAGDEIRFDLVRKGNGDEITIHFEGKIEGETMKLRMQFGRRNPIDITARKAL